MGYLPTTDNIYLIMSKCSKGLRNSKVLYSEEKGLLSFSMPAREGADNSLGSFDETFVLVGTVTGFGKQ